MDYCRHDLVLLPVSQSICPVQFYAGMFSIHGIGNVSTCRKQNPCAQRRAEAALGPSCCPWPLMSYLGLRGQCLFCLCQWKLEMSSLSSSLKNDEQQFEEAEKREAGFCSDTVSRGIAFAYSQVLLEDDSRECCKGR